MLVVVASMSVCFGAGVGVAVGTPVGFAVGVGDVQPDSAATVTIAIIAKMVRLITLFDSIVIAIH
jgi:hypothetical protein